MDCPSFSFLIEHESGRKLVFDLGVRKDYWNLSDYLVERKRTRGFKADVKQGVREILEENGVQGKDIEAIIWSHWHWDHIGDPSTFEPHTTLIVGPGFKEKFPAGFPTIKDSPIRDSDWAGRELREISFKDGLKIGNFAAFDYFGDGSFYLLDSPGHAVGHLCGIARVTTSPDSFILMGGDACHHGGEFRPSKYLPLPAMISPNPLNKSSPQPCPGSLFEHLLPERDPTKEFYRIARFTNGTGISHDPDEAERTIEKVQEADCQDNVLVVMAHDDVLLDVVDFFPKYANDFVEKGWQGKGRWAFLKDFREAVQQ